MIYNSNPVYLKNTIYYKNKHFISTQQILQGDVPQFNQHSVYFLYLNLMNVNNKVSTLI